MKLRRDITLGEMQDECKKFTDGLCGGKSCAYQDLCNQMKSGCTPHAWDLTDPPRFDEQQMALLRIMMDIGAEYATQRNGSVGFYTAAPMRRVALIDVTLFDEGRSECIAELLGKD